MSICRLFLSGSLLHRQFSSPATARTLAKKTLNLATSGKGGVGPYVGICALVACFGIADAHVQGGMMGDLSFMCPEFIQLFLAGLAASGVLTSCLRLAAKAAFDKYNNGQRKRTLLFLAMSTAFELACIFLYAYVFPKLPIVKHYRAKAAAEGSRTVSADLAVAGIQTSKAESENRLGNIELIRQNWDYVLDIYLIYVFTLSIYPGFIYENTGSNHQLGSWYLLVLIALCSLCDFISRYIPLIICLKLENRNILMYAVISRFTLVPAFYFAGKYAAQGWMMLLTSFLGLTNGYLRAFPIGRVGLKLHLHMACHISHGTLSLATSSPHRVSHGGKPELAGYKGLSRMN